jgi:hypothetical protein
MAKIFLKVQHVSKEKVVVSLSVPWLWLGQIL